MVAHLFFTIALLLKIWTHLLSNLSIVNVSSPNNHSRRHVNDLLELINQRILIIFTDSYWFWTLLADMQSKDSKLIFSFSKYPKPAKKKQNLIFFINDCQQWLNNQSNTYICVHENQSHVRAKKIVNTWQWYIKQKKH